MRRRCGSLGLVFASLAATVACRYDPFAHEFTRTKPKAEDLVGVYRLDDRSS